MYPRTFRGSVDLRILFCLLTMSHPKRTTPGCLAYSMFCLVIVASLTQWYFPNFRCFENQMKNKVVKVSGNYFLSYRILNT